MREVNIFYHRHGFLLIFGVLCLVKSARSAVYTVGDEHEWDSGRNYDSWAQKYKFSVGDVLDFKYVKGQHNVYEVEEATYRSCDPMNGVMAKYESGNDEVQLKEAKKYWFICNVDGHCLGGMRFFIDVKGANNTTSSAPQPTSQMLPPPISYATQKKLGFWGHICLFGIFINLLWLYYRKFVDFLFFVHKMIYGFELFIG